MTYDGNKPETITEENARAYLQERLPEGWTIAEMHVVPGKSDCLWYYVLGWQGTVARVTKGDDVIDLMVNGEINIYGKDEDCLDHGSEYFRYDEHGPEGKLTQDLIDNGNEVNNNWFEVNENGSAFMDCEEVSYDLAEGLLNIASRARAIDKGNRLTFGEHDDEGNVA